MEQEVFYRAKGQGLGFKDLVSLHNTTAIYEPNEANAAFCAQHETRHNFLAHINLLAPHTRHISERFFISTTEISEKSTIEPHYPEL